MPRRHVVAHLDQVAAQGVVRVGYAEDGVERGNDATLGPRLASELLRVPVEHLHSLVHHSPGQCRMILPAVDVGANAPKIDVRIAMLRHASQRAKHRLDTCRDRAQGIHERSGVLLGHRAQSRPELAESARGFELDIDVNTDEPVLVRSAKEVLQQHDVAELYGTFCIDPRPVVERIGRVREHGRTAQPQGDLAPGYGDARGDAFGRRVPRPDVRVADIGEEQHGAPQLGLVLQLVDEQLRQALEDLLDVPREQEPRQVVPHLFERVELLGQLAQRVRQRQKAALA